MGWREDRRFTYMNRGLETQIAMTKVTELPGQFRVKVFERMVGGQPTQVHESVSFEDESHGVFNHYCEQAMLSEYNPLKAEQEPQLKAVNPVAHAEVVAAGHAESGSTRCPSVNPNGGTATCAKELGHDGEHMNRGGTWT